MLEHLTTTEVQNRPVLTQELVYQFEQAFRTGKRPLPEDVLRGTAADRKPLLIELIHSELELRLRTGEYPSTTELQNRPVLIQELVYQFEQAFRTGRRPLPEDFVRGTAADREPLLIELIHSELELRLRTGESASLAEYLARYPTLTTMPDALAAILETELRVRVQLGEVPDPRNYEEGFPQLGGLVRAAFRKAGLAPPEVPGYEVLEEIGRGGMGVIFRVRDADLRRVVAVKVLRGELAGDPTASRRFVEEARITGQLQHPGVPPVHELGHFPDGRPFLTMKLIEGQTFASLLAGRPAPSAELSRFVQTFESVCQTVGYAHSRGVVHRDLKPANVMVGAFGEVQVMDWGLARVLAEPHIAAPSGDGLSASAVETGRHHGSETEAGSVVGTYPYMPPEQARGESGVGPVADVFSLGAMLCEILTGAPPYTGSRAVVRAIAEAGDTADALTRLDACSAPAELIDVAKRCLEADATHRPADGSAVAALVAAYRSGVTERLRKAERERSAAEARVAEQRRKQWWQSAAAIATAVIVAGGIAFAWWQDRQTGQKVLRESEFNAKQTDFNAKQAIAEADRRAEGQQVRVGVDAGLKLSARLRTQYRYAAAADALAQAAKRLETGLADDLKPVVERAREESALTIALDDIRMRATRWTPELGKYDRESAPPAYRRVLGERGFDPAAGTVANLATWVNASGVRAEVIDALEDWALLEPDKTVVTRLLEVLRAADPDPWADQLRDPAVRTDRAALLKLAETIDPETPPARIVVLSQLLHRAGADPQPHLDAALARHPASFPLLFDAGLQAQDRNNRGRAASHFEAALAIRPDNMSTLYNLGLNLDASGQPAASVKVWDEYLRRDPDYASAHFNRGYALEHTRDIPGAVASYRRALAQNPKHVKVRTNLGHLLFDLGQRDEALALLREQVRLFPSEPFGQSGLAMRLAEAGRFREALPVAREAIRLNEKSSAAHNALGAALNGTGQTDEAIVAYKKACDLSPKDAAPRYNLALLHMNAKNDLPAAIAAARDAIRADPLFLPAYTILGLALALAGELKEADVVSREALRLGPNDAGVHRLRVLVLSFSNKKAEAVEAAREAVRCGPKDPVNHGMLANILIDTGKLDEAIAVIQEAIKLNPKGDNSYSVLGEIYLNKKDFPAALAANRKAVELAPNQTLYWINQGRIFEAMGDWDGAIAAYREAVRCGPRPQWLNPQGTLTDALKRKAAFDRIAPPPRAK